jgi:hypothetical protein
MKLAVLHESFLIAKINPATEKTTAATKFVIPDRPHNHELQLVVSHGAARTRPLAMADLMAAASIRNSTHPNRPAIEGQSASPRFSILVFNDPRFRGA